MSQVGKFLRKSTDGYAHWCPACQEMHRLPNGWQFNGRLDSPSFQPSFRHTGLRRNIVDGKWIGEGREAWLYDAKGEPLPYCCHYMLTDGILHFCGDCTHAMKGQSIPLPEISHQD